MLPTAVVLLRVTVTLLTVVVVAGEVTPDVVTTQLGTEPLLEVQSVVEPALVVLPVQTAGALPVAVQLWVELSLVMLDIEVPLPEVQVVVVPPPDVLTVQPAGTLATLSELPGLLDDDPLLLELDEPLLLELDDPLLLELKDE